MTATIEPIPAFVDNYIWCLHDGRDAWLVDPGDAEPALAFLAQRNLRLEGILITHHHHDHIGGIAALQSKHPGIDTWGPANSTINGLTRTLKEGDRITALTIEFEVLEVPGHTLDHIAYIAANHMPPLLFCGDTLFAAGCGRLFEGTASQMYTSLKKIAELPENTEIYCTHEYTQSNLRFAIAVEPDNLRLQQRIEDTAQLRLKRQPTLPSTLSLELATNPFLRGQEPAVRIAAERHIGPCTTPADVFAALRHWKDQF